MSDLKISLWDKTWTLDSLFLDLSNEKMHYSLYQELMRGLILKEGFDEYHLSADLRTPELEKELLDTFCQAQKISSPEVLMEYLSKTRQLLEELQDKLFFHYRAEEFKKLVIDEGQVREKFLEQKASRDQVLFQLIRTETEKEARELYQKIKAGQGDFTSLAQAHSLGDEAKHGGIVGPVPFRVLNQELAELLLKLSSGEFTEPFQIEGSSAFLILRLLRLDRSDLTPPLEQSIRDELFDLWIQKKKILGDAKLCS